MSRCVRGHKAGFLTDLGVTPAWAQEDSAGEVGLGRGPPDFGCTYLLDFSATGLWEEQDLLERESENLRATLED